MEDQVDFRLMHSRLADFGKTLSNSRRYFSIYSGINNNYV